MDELLFYKTPNDQEAYNRGFDDAFLSLSSIVKRLGKKYYKEFLLEVKRKENKFYTSSTSTLANHKCNCEYCELKQSDDNN